MRNAYLNKRMWILFCLLLIVLSLVCDSRPVPRRVTTLTHQVGGDASSVKARGISIRNIGDSPLRFSKVGFFQTADDAQSNRGELVGQSPSSVRLYTTGIALILGSGIEFEPTGSYLEVSSANNITLLPKTALVIDFATDVSFRAVRLGKLDRFTDPTACRLQWSTSGPFATVADAAFSTPMFMTFRNGDTQANAFLRADGTHVAPSGIFTASPSSFSDLQASRIVVVAKQVGAQSIVVPTKLVNASVLIVGGGGGGAFAGGGGGGAGGIVFIANATIDAGTYSVTVGAGGAGAGHDGARGTTGGDSVAFGLTAHGGGGGSHVDSGLQGGCGGGAGYGGGTGGGVTPGPRSGTAPIGSWVRYGNVGGSNPRNNAGRNYGCAGGGGVGAVGGECTSTYGGDGGDGMPDWSDMGAAAGVGHEVNGVYWFGGGGGGSSENNLSGKGGKGGGGGGSSGILASPNLSEPKAKSGLANTGGGGGGGRMSPPSNQPPAGSGGSGVIIVLGQRSVGPSPSTASPGVNADATWTPAQMATAIWLDATDASTLKTVGGAVSRAVSEWRDKSGNARHAVQSDAARMPSSASKKVNNLPVVTFDGVDDYMDVLSPVLRDQSTPNLFYVFVRNGRGSGDDGYRAEVTPLPSSGNDNGAFHYVNPSGLGASYPLYSRGWGQYDLSTGAPYVDDSPELISFATLGGRWNVYRNGSSEGGGVAATALTDTTGIRLAHQVHKSRTSSISLAEVILAFGASNETRERIEGYLAWKWGVVGKLPSNHPYKRRKPT